MGMWDTCSSLHAYHSGLCFSILERLRYGYYLADCDAWSICCTQAIDLKDGEFAVLPSRLCKLELYLCITIVSERVIILWFKL